MGTRGQRRPRRRPVSSVPQRVNLKKRENLLELVPRRCMGTSLLVYNDQIELGHAPDVFDSNI